MKRKAKAVWCETGRDGDLTTESGVLHETSHSYRTRFENGQGTNPEELIAAAHLAVSRKLTPRSHVASGVQG